MAYRAENLSNLASRTNPSGKVSPAESADILIIGGGPAGLAAAIAARQHGLKVVVADARRPPIDKACGEGLLPETCAALAKLGISILESESHSFRGIRFVSGESSVQADFPDGSGMGVRRTVLHRHMVQRAETLGVSLRWETPVTGLRPEGAVLRRKIFSSPWIIGADGGNSLVRRWAGLNRGRMRVRYAFRRHYRAAPWSEYMEVHWAPRCQLYVTPVSQTEVCIALASHDPQLRLDAALPLFPEVAKRLSGAECTSSERGAVSATRSLHRVYRNRVVLVGDASGAVDCVTGEGLGLAFRQADALASCLQGGSLSGYHEMHKKLSRRPALMSRLLLALDRKPTLRRQAMRAFASDPRLFERMVAMHVGVLSSVESVSTGLSIGWQILRREFAG